MKPSTKHLHYVRDRFEPQLASASSILNKAACVLVVIAVVAYQANKTGQQIAEAIECYGISCEQYALILGQADKESRAERKQSTSAKPSIFSVVD